MELGFGYIAEGVATTSTNLEFSIVGRNADFTIAALSHLQFRLITDQVVAAVFLGNVLDQITEGDHVPVGSSIETIESPRTSGVDEWLGASVCRLAKPARIVFANALPSNVVPVVNPQQQW